MTMATTIIFTDVYTNKQRKEETCGLFRELGDHTKGLRYATHKPKAQNTLNKKSGNTGHSSNSNQPKKKDKKSSIKTAKDDMQGLNQLCYWCGVDGGFADPPENLKRGGSNDVQSNNEKKRM
uniref:Uncharacterized protein n=1 Tax=Rhizophagus irregularis (strain DAOM 181602 / DAOM 197198 / MUCL 43194) TaxID=747089 RepID=U9T844_RHIID